MIAFFNRFQKVAERETRAVTLLRPMGGLPVGDYALVEFYCEEPDCDCRRVIIQIWRQDRPGTPLATFNYGWESKSFYKKWMRGDDKLLEEMHGLTVEPFGRQSRHTAPLLALVERVLREDPAYVERLKRHYQMFKASLKPSGGAAGESGNG
jgi:hypothetical protein